jgi:hypothetical protein
MRVLRGTPEDADVVVAVEVVEVRAVPVVVDEPAVPWLPIAAAAIEAGTRDSMSKAGRKRRNIVYPPGISAAQARERMAAGRADAWLFALWGASTGAGGGS